MVSIAFAEMLPVITSPLSMRRRSALITFLEGVYTGRRW